MRTMNTTFRYYSTTQVYNYLGVLTRTQTKGPFVLQALNWVRSDIVVTERNKEKEAKNIWRPPLPYTSSWLSDAVVTGSCILRSKPGTYHPRREVTTERLLWSGYNRDVWVTDTELAAIKPGQTTIDASIIKARNTVAGRVAGFAESMAELRKTVASLGSAAKAVDQFLLYAVQRKWGKAARALGVSAADPRAKRAAKKAQKAGGDMGSIFLAYAFGVSPIISDMVSLCVLLSGQWSIRVSGKATHLSVKDTVQSSVTLPGSGGYGMSFVLKGQQTLKREAGAFTRLDYEVDSTILRDFAAFGVSDVVQVGWAVTPYSWLVDFVLPVSEVLRSLTATIGLTFKGGSTTTFWSVDKAVRDIYPVANSTSYVVESYSASDALAVRREMNRTVHASEPNPVNLWLKDPFQAFQAAASMSLLAVKLQTHFK